MGRVQHPRIERQRRDILRGTLPKGTHKGTQGRQRGRQGTQSPAAVGRRVGRLKVCLGRYAYIRPHDVCALALCGAAVRNPGPPGSRLMSYDYDLLVDVLHRHTGRPRHVVIDWVQEKVIPLAARPNPTLKIIYK